jgi:UDP:flavonoid glycosyltransferase YjiC (YdhE family)
MRILVATLGSIGDLMPFLAVAEVLRQRGHEVIIGSNAGYAPLVQRAGFGFAVLWNAMPAPLDDLLERAPEEAWDRVRRDLFVAAAEPTAAFIRHAGMNRNCAVLASWSAFGAVDACAQKSLPLFRACLSPHAVREAAIGPGWDAQTWLGFFPDWFCPPKAGWPNIRLTGFPAHDDSLVPPLAPALESFLTAGQAPIIFTPGSYQRQSTRFFTESAEACKALGARAIFLTPYAAQIPGELPDGIIHVTYAPLHRLAGQAAALVHHGGIGTLAQGLRSGIPQIAVPQFFDQFDNARHLEMLGAGCVLSASEYRASELVPRLDTLLRDAAVRQRCREIQSRFTGRNPADDICNDIESTAR